MEKTKDLRSSDPAAQAVLKVADRQKIETVWDRLNRQQPQCKTGQQGVCCRICSMGPCRIARNGKQPDRGVCGADADTIVARNLIRMIAAGASSHSDHGRKPALLLREIAAGRNREYAIRDEKKLRSVAGRLGIDTELGTMEVAAQVAELTLQSFGNQDAEPISTLQSYMPLRRQRHFTALSEQLTVETGFRAEFLPRSIDREPVDVLHRTTMGTDHDPLSLLAQGIRCALADGWGGSLIATELQDVLFGTPQAKAAEANLGVISADHVNILIHGHEPALSEKLIDCALGEEMQQLAREQGAEGVKVIGMCCTVNEALMRRGIPVAGNHLHQELAVMTGAIEAVVVDVQCILPSMVNLTRCFHTRFITTSDQALFPGAIHMQYDEANVGEISKQVVRTAIDAFGERSPGKVNIPGEVIEARVGYCVEELIRHLGGTLQPLVTALAEGAIRGVVGIVGCNNPKTTQDYLHVGLARELIRKGVLVLGTGCSAIAMAKAGMMDFKLADQASEGLRDFCRRHNLPPILHMGSCVDCSRLLLLFSDLAEALDVDVAQLPAAGSAPEWTTEKALSIGTYLAASGLPVHLGHSPPIAGSGIVSKILTEDMGKLFGGYFFIEENARLAAEKIVSALDGRRRKLAQGKGERPADLAC